MTNHDRSIKPGCLATLLLIVGVSCTHVAASDDVITFQTEVMRHWRDRSGAFGVDGVMVSYHARRVLLRDSNGKWINVPIDQLCEADQRYVVAKLRAQRRKNVRAKPAGTERTARVRVVSEKTDRATHADSPEPERAEIQPPEALPSEAVFEHLFGIDWYRANVAFDIAAELHKPVMWFRVLGDLNGFM